MEIDGRSLGIGVAASSLHEEERGYFGSFERCTHSDRCVGEVIGNGYCGCSAMLKVREWS